MIELEDIHKTFEDHYVLKGVNLKVSKGESLVVIGGSGSGKSVMLKHVIGLTRPTRGEVWFEDARIDGLPEARSAGRSVPSAHSPQPSTRLAARSVGAKILMWTSRQFRR